MDDSNPFQFTHQLRTDKEGEPVKDKRRFFDKEAKNIFKAQQSWKKVPDFLKRCEFCEGRFVAGRSDKKTCCTECRRRKSAGEPQDICVRCNKPIARCEPVWLDSDGKESFSAYNRTKSKQWSKYCYVCVWLLKQSPAYHILLQSGVKRYKPQEFSKMIREARGESDEQQ